MVISQWRALLTEMLGTMCEFMLKQTKEKNMPWLLMMANNTVAELHRLRYLLITCHRHVLHNVQNY